MPAAADVKQAGQRDARELLAPCAGERAGAKARAAIWVRTFDTHEAIVVATMDGKIISDYYTEMYGTLAWRPLADLPQQTSKFGQHNNYHDQLAGRTVLDTARQAFDTLATMVQP